MHNFQQSPAVQLSILTPCDPARAQFLPEAAESVEQLRELIDLEWIVVFDGPAPAGELGNFGDITLSHGARRGVSAARNTALEAASGAIVVPLDADDRIVVQGAVEALSAFDTDGELGWVAANRVDLATGNPTKHWHGDRSWQPGELSTWPRDRSLAFHPNSILVRRELALSFGGWNTAYDYGEDLIFMLNCGELGSGQSVAGVLHGYRSWSGQTVATADYNLGYEARSEAILDWLNGLRLSLGREAV